LKIFFRLQPSPEEEKTPAFDEGPEGTAKIAEEETSSGEPESWSGGAWWKAEAVMEEETLAAGGGAAPTDTAPVPDLDKSWWVPPTAPPLDPGPEAAEDPAPESAEEPEPEAVEEAVDEGAEEAVEEAAGPVAEESSVVMEPEPQAEFSFARDYDSEPPPMKDEEVELFRKAVMVVVREKKGSISLLQRELGLGYFKAAKLLNILELRGIVAPYAGSIARKVIIGEEQAERIIGGEGP